MGAETANDKVLSLSLSLSDNDNHIYILSCGRWPKAKCTTSFRRHLRQHHFLLPSKAAQPWANDQFWTKFSHFAIEYDSYCQILGVQEKTFIWARALSFGEWWWWWWWISKARPRGFQFFMACSEVKKRRESRVEGGRVIQLPCLEVF